MSDLGSPDGFPSGNPTSEGVKDQWRMGLMLAVVVLVLAAFGASVAGFRFGFW